MHSQIPLREFWRRLPLFTAAGGFLCLGIFATRAAVPDQPVGDAVGMIEGEAINVTGPMSVEVVRGQVKTLLRSGSDIRVKSGLARIDLVEGGQITICGPAHLSVLKSGGSLTVALDSGVIHFFFNDTATTEIYTPQIQAQPLAIGDGPQDILVGFATPGAMCIRTSRGAVRLEQQLTGQSVIVPQGGDVLVANGQLDTLRNGAGLCACELQIAKTAPVPPPPPRVSAAASTEEERKVAVDPKPSAGSSVAEQPARDEPVYQVFMPPLRFDANARVQPEPDPRLLVVIRRVRVRPTLVFRGKVEGDAVATAAVTPPPQPAASLPVKTTPPASDSVIDRMRNFVRKLWSRSS